MLIYDRDDIRIYATAIPPLPEGVPGARSVAERAAVKRLVREAFPGMGARVAHRESGAPYLEFEGDEGRSPSARSTRQPAGGLEGSALPRHGGEGEWALLGRDGPGADGGVSEEGLAVPKGELTVPEVSISHCRRLAVMALAAAGRGIGIDCECGNRAGQLRRVAPRFLSGEQRGVWDSSEAMLFWAWTIKEAAYKAAGGSVRLGEIPLPAEIPVGAATRDSEIVIGGRRYGVFQADSPDPAVIVMVVSEVEAAR